MHTFTLTMASNFHPLNTQTNEITKTHFPQFLPKPLSPPKPTNFSHRKLQLRRPLVSATVGATAATAENGEGKPKFKWVEVGPGITETQKEAISKLPPKMTKRCKAFMKKLICFSPYRACLNELLGAWMRIMKPRRADWLAVLSAELALPEESFEANIRDYTKIIYSFGKQNRLKDAERTLLATKSRGFICDQVTLTTFIHMYSKAGNLRLGEETFEELKLLGEPLDKRSYGLMIMAYVRAGMPEQGENLLSKMDTEEIYAGSEVYKALLRAYSMTGNAQGAQRVFDAIQLAGTSPDAKLCGLLINAYGELGQSEEAYVVFKKKWRAGLEPSDKCVALVLRAYEKENKLQRALDFLMELERDGIIVGKEASETLVGWFRKLGVVKEIDFVLREYALKESVLKFAFLSFYLQSLVSSSMRT